jgi:hypothetical protein
MRGLVILVAIMAQGLAMAQGVQVYLGWSYTFPTNLEVVQQGHPNTTVQQAEFATRSFTDPLYYGVRVWWGEARGLRAEIELIHQKLYFEKAAQNGDVLNRFQVTDGLNLLLFNVAYALDTGPVFPVARIGAGLAIPHPETIVRGKDFGVDGDPLYYHFGGFALQAGLEGQARWPGVGIVGSIEAKYTWAATRFQIADGFAYGEFSTLHAVVGGGYSLR